jgi:hypothetical protein
MKNQVRTTTLNPDFFFKTAISMKPTRTSDVKRRINLNSIVFKSWSPGTRKGHNRENQTCICLYWKKNLSRTSRPDLIKLGTNHPWVREFKILQIKGQILFKGEIITKMQKLGWGHLKTFFLKNDWAHSYMKAFWHNVDSSLFIMVMGVGRGQVQKNIFILKKIFSRTAGQFHLNLEKIILG